MQREPHRGKGGAVRSGLMAARGALRFMCDADLSMPVFFALYSPSAVLPRTCAAYDGAWRSPMNVSASVEAGVTYELRVAAVGPAREFEITTALQ